VRGRVDPHRHDVGVLAGDGLVHLEEVAVLVRDGVATEPVDRRGEVEVDPVLQRAHASAGVDLVLGVARGDVARHEVAEGRVLALEEVVAVLLGDVGRGAGLVGVRRDPDATVVAQRLGHQRQLRLELVGRRDAGRVDLRVAGVGEVGALAVRAPGGGDVGRHRVGRQEEDVGVPAGAEHDRMRRVTFDRTRDEVAGDDPHRPAVHDDELEHLGVGHQLDGPGRDLAHQRLVGAEQQLLAGLAPGVEGAPDLGATEGAVVEEPAVLAGERHALRGALVDDVVGHLGQPVDVGLAGAVVPALHRVVEQAVDRVTLAVVVLGRVDAALRGDRVGPARAVVEGEHLHPVAELAEGRGCRRAGEPRPHDDDLELALVVRAHQRHRELVVLPLALERSVGDLRVEHHQRCFRPVRARAVGDGQDTIPSWTAIGKLRLPRTTTRVKPTAKARRQWLNRRLFHPIDWNRLQTPW
jgi:hypothetical protein